jgi:hypothetical protein
VKSLRPVFPENGAGSSSQKLQFKQGIKPSPIRQGVIDVAKDGTNRGGRRVKAGSKPDALADKITRGAPARRMELPDFTDDLTDLDTENIGDGVELEGMDMPSPDDYLSAQQKDGKPLGADEIYKETWLWLKERGCDRLVNKRLLESYSEAFARYIQCSEAVSKYGLLGKHPTTGAAIASPFVQLSLNFQKQANLLWYEIYDIVKQNCTEPFEGSPQDSVMEQLLRSRRNM